MRIAVYPGTFDPITNGHLNIIERSSKLFDLIYVVVPSNINKNVLFSLDERIALLKEATKDLKNIIIDSTPHLTVDYCRQVNANCIIRGLRMVSDFEYELQMAAINKSLDQDIETIFIMSDHSYSFLSSSSVKEIAAFGGKIDDFVPASVKKALNEKFQK